MSYTLKENRGKKHVTPLSLILTLYGNENIQDTLNDIKPIIELNE